jgi:hypothetical protein
MKKIEHVKDRKLQSGRIVSQLNKEIPMTISSMCPDKWLFVDLENGNVWHIREDEYNQKDNYHFWRSANKKELRELKKLRT